MLEKGRRRFSDEGGVMKRIAVIVSVLLITLALFGVANAKAPPPREQRVDEWAKRVQQRISNVIAHFNSNKDRHIATYNNVKVELKELADTLSAKGYDVTKVTQDYQTLDSRVQKAAQDYATLIGYLTTAQGFVPGHAEGQFRAAIQQARSQLVVVRDDARDIRNFYWTVIRPDVQALKSQKPTAPSTTTPATSAPATTP